jgi:hypothetical protein
MNGGDMQVPNLLEIGELRPLRAKRDQSTLPTSPVLIDYADKRFGTYRSQETGCPASPQCPSAIRLDESTSNNSNTSDYPR